MTNITLSGSEVLQVLPIQANGQLAATTGQTTTGAIAALAATQTTNFVNTAIGTAGNGILTAAGIVGGLITRTGPTAAYSDTTDTAANIIAALPSAVIGQDITFFVKNGTAFWQTIVAGAGVTLPASVTVPPFSVGQYVMSVTSATAVAFIHLTTDVINNAYSTNTALTAVTNTSTMTAILGLSAGIQASGTYSILGAVQVNCTAGGGGALAFNTSPSGTLTASSLNVTGKFYTATGIAVNNTLTFGSTPGSGIGTSAPIVLAEFVGSFVASAAGVLQVYGGQQAANAGSTNFLANGYLQVERVA